MNPVDKFFDRIVQQVVDIIMPKVVEMIAHSGAQARDGFVLRGTYNPVDGHATVVFSDTAAVFTDQGDTPLMISMPINTGGIGNQVGLVGDERVKIHATQSGYVATLVHDAVDSPGAAPGEQIIGAYSNPIFIGAKALNATNDAGMRAQNSQTLADAIIAHVQTAIDQVCENVQGGTGISPPTIASVTATGSTKVLISD